MNPHDDITTQLAHITQEIAALPPLPSPGEYIALHKGFCDNDDMPALVALTKTNAAIRQRRKALDQQRHALEAQLATLKASNPTTAAETRVMNSSPAPTFEEPTLTLLREQAKAQASTPPVVAPVASQPLTQQDEGEALMVAAQQRREAWRKRLSGDC